jgi:hypothetical protein
VPQLVMIFCPCCRLNQPVRDEDGSLDGRLCSRCIEHRALDEATVVRRALEHESMLRERCERAREIATDRDERMKAAFRSRERAIRYLRDLRALHEPRKNGSCSCGVKRDCESSRILDSFWIMRMVNKLVLAEEDERLHGDREFWDNPDDDEVPPRPRGALPVGRT